MPMIEEQITESIQTGAPSIKYEAGRDEVASMPDKEAELYQIFLDALKNGDLPPGTDFDAFKELVMKSMQQPQGNMQAQGMMQPQGMMQDPRATAAYGGIMGLDNRKRYGLGSSLKKFVRNIIPNEVSEIAVKAAPFVAPFNAPLAGLMAGVGSFDQTGKVGSSLAKGLGTYGMGRVVSGIGGGGYQTGKSLNPFSGDFYTQFSKPYVPGKDIFSKTKDKFFSGVDKIKDVGTSGNQFTQFTKEVTNPQDTIESLKLAKNTENILKKAGMNSSAIMAILGLSTAVGLYTGATEGEETLEGIDRGARMDIMGIREEVIEAMKDPSGEKLKILSIKYPYLGEQSTKDVSSFAHGGRIRAQEGGLMDLGGMEKDYRDDGGFVPLGGEEKADDVPARLSKNEFVFTADAVRGAGDGDVDLGAEKLGGLMAVLEEKGKNSGAEEMFSVSERIGEVI